LHPLYAIAADKKHVDNYIMTKELLIFIVAFLAITINSNLYGQKDSSAKSVATFTVPEIQAEYPGGYKELIKYLKTTVTDKLTSTQTTNNVGKVVVKFFVDENGKTTDAKIFKTSNDATVDKLFIDAVNKMPVWKPAEQPKGKKVKQEFTIPLYICLK
jgi:TonB family protein